MVDDVLTSSQRLVAWIKEEAIPLWVQSGVDTRNGSSFERMFANGSPDLSSDRSMYVQARQIYVFSRAEKMGWAKSLRGLVKRMFEFVGRDATLPCRSDGYVHLLNKDFEIIDSTRRLYDHAFFILGSAAAYSAYGQGAELRRAHNIIEWLDLRYKHPAGGWREDNNEGKERRQSSHMYMFEAFLYLFDVTKKEQWLKRAESIFELLCQRFVQGNGDILFEYFDDQWQPITDEAHAILQPGNMLYWSWLVARYEEAAQLEPSQLSSRLYHRALELGEDKNSGLVNNQANLEGRCLSMAKTSSDLTHLIKASLRQARTGNKKAEQKAVAAINRLFEHFLTREVGGTFVDRIEGDGHSETSICSAANFYHILNAGIEAADYVRVTLNKKVS